MTPHQQLLSLIVETLEASSATQAVYGREFVMEPGDQLVGYRVKLNLPDYWLRLDVSTARARPPFEWSGEITSDGPTGLEHYLVRDDDVVRAERKNLTVLSPVEVMKIIELMLQLQDNLKQLKRWKPGSVKLALIDK